MMLSFWLGCYYGFVLGFLGATCWRHWLSLYDGPTPRIHEETLTFIPEVAADQPVSPFVMNPPFHWRRRGP